MMANSGNQHKKLTLYDLGCAALVADPVVAAGIALAAGMIALAGGLP